MESERLDDRREREGRRKGHEGRGRACQYTARMAPIVRFVSKNVVKIPAKDTPWIILCKMNEERAMKQNDNNERKKKL